MRIISGLYKGRRLQAPKKLPVRPTTDMAKESLFNILNNYYYFPQVRVLDLFAGIGSIALEFGSRGSTSITAVDSNYGCISFIKSTANTFELPIDTIKSDVYSFLEKDKGNYDIIFADPPYDFEESKFLKIVTLVFQNKLLDEEGMLIIEHSKHTALDQGMHYSHSRNYGGSVFSFFELPEDHQESTEED